MKADEKSDSAPRSHYPDRLDRETITWFPVAVVHVIVLGSSVGWQ